ncbi:hypothetical protein B7494_g6016 [Chlorociboria aeruginascens]|nr:hypothetical protein B7494_g6016 [Chlorociboria aeruginascens]
MPPLTPHWAQPSHPSIQTVILSPEEFSSKSLSKVTLPPFALLAKLDFPPCTSVDEPTYATVQVAKHEHMSLNSDLVFINHSCDPSVIFDMTSLTILAGPKGLKVGQELTFFYPSTEWDMAQGFTCLCGTAQCRGYIDGARNMQREKLEGMWLNVHIREMLEERDGDGLGKDVDRTARLSGGEELEGAAEKASSTGVETLNPHGKEHGGGANASVRNGQNGIEKLLRDNLGQAKKFIEGAERALGMYLDGSGGRMAENRDAGRRGVTNREMSGEMGGDTAVVV